MTSEEIARIRCGHTEVSWRDKDGVECSGWIVGHNLDGFQIMVDGRIHTVKPSEVEEVPPAPIHQLHRDVCSEMTASLRRHVEDHELEAEVARRRASAVPQVPLSS